MAGGGKSDLGEVLTRLDTHTLAKLKDWLDENRERAVERHGYDTWFAVRTLVGLETLFWLPSPRI
jgi:hypothetical protein